MKKCRICGLEKEDKKFGPSLRHKDGLRTDCYECRKLEAKKYREKNREILKIKKRQKYLLNKEQEREKRKILYSLHKEEIIEKRKKYYVKNKEEIKIKQKKYYEKNKDKAKQYAKQNAVRIKLKTELRRQTLEYRYDAWKRNAEARGIIWKLNLEFLKSIPLKCFYTGVDLTFKFKEQNTISLDRLDSSKGYIKENVVFCCWKFNEMKQDYSVEQFVKSCEEIVSNKNNILNKIHAIL